MKIWVLSLSLAKWILANRINNECRVSCLRFVVVRTDLETA
jgi:hypothetical protein